MNIGHCLTVRIQDESCEVPQAADKTLTQRLLCLSPARKPVNGPRTIDDAKILFFSFLHSRFLINFYAIVITVRPPTLPERPDESLTGMGAVSLQLTSMRHSASSFVTAEPRRPQQHRLRGVSPTRSPAQRPLPHTAAVALCGGTKLACLWHARVKRATQIRDAAAPAKASADEQEPMLPASQQKPTILRKTRPAI